MNDLHARNVGTNIVALQFKLGDKVKIEGIDATGIVYSASISRDGIEYCVKYFSDNDARCIDWFQGCELTRV